MPSGVTKLSLTELNPHLTCALCSGYFIDAVTIVECLHSFCRACLLRYLESSETCAICDCLVNKIQLHRSIRSDQTLQDLTYKLVPGLYKSELRRRKDFYVNYFKRLGDNPCGSASTRSKVQIFDRHLVELSALIYTPDELISLSLEYAPTPKSPETKSATDHLRSGAKRRKMCKADETDEQQAKLDDIGFRKKYFRCPAAITINHLKKLLRYKLELNPDHHVEILHSDEPLEGSFTLMDVAYIYTWRRKAPMQLFFRVCKFEAAEEDPTVTLAAMPQLVKEVQMEEENSAVPSETGADGQSPLDSESLSALKAKILGSKADGRPLLRASSFTTVPSAATSEAVGPADNLSPTANAPGGAPDNSGSKRVGAKKRKPPKPSPTRVEKVPTDPDARGEGKEGLKVKMELGAAGYFITKPLADGGSAEKKISSDKEQTGGDFSLQKGPTPFSVANLCS